MEKITIQQCLKEQGFYMAGVHGDSMMPMLRQGKDVVKIVPAKGILKELDLPLYQRPTGEYVLHRIIAVKDGYYITCGDNRFLKEKVPFGWIVGVMESFVQDGMEIMADDSKYLAYVKKIRRSFWRRRIRRKFRKLFS
ncbi:MAG: S24/S26 family peptidase [Eubacterium sp.]|nr:S24/S26 family peptidase [Eubacterium sp.]